MKKGNRSEEIKGRINPETKALIAQLAAALPKTQQGKVSSMDIVIAACQHFAQLDEAKQIEAIAKFIAPIA